MKIEIGQIFDKNNRIDVISIVFLFFSFFPYLKIVETGSDLQPLSFLIGILYLFIKSDRIKLHKLSYFILLTLTFVLLFFLLGVIMQYDIVLVRTLYSYTSIFIHSLVAYDIIRRKPSFLSFVVEWVIYIWFIVGFVQNYLYPGFLTFLLSRGSGYDATASGGRGVISLAVEPTFYGIQCFFLLLFVLLIKNTTRLYPNKKAYLLLALCLIQIVLFSRSSMVILFLLLIICTLIFTYLFKKPIYTILAIIIVFVLFSLFFSLMNTESRIFILANTLLDSPKQILMLDRSINYRISDIYYSMKGFLDYPLGHGLNGWQSYLKAQSQSLIFVKTEQTRIMSFLGSFLFETGIFSFFLIYYIFRNVSNFLRGINSENHMWYIVAFLILLTAIQQSYPPLWILLSTALILTKEKKKALLLATSLSD